MVDEKEDRLSPQEKKRLSYLHDRRNVYGENDKSSRKAIPLRKKLANRQARHADRLEIHDKMRDEEAVQLKRPKPTWKKAPDAPLGSVVAGQLARRAKQRRRGDGDSEPGGDE